MTPPTKAELQQVMRDGLAVLEEMGAYGDESIECPERQRAREWCWRAIEVGASLGYWPPVPPEVMAKVGRR